MKLSKISLTLIMALAFSSATIAQNNDLMAFNDTKTNKTEANAPSSSQSFIAITSDRISNDTFLTFSEDMVGRKFHLIDDRDEIFLTKTIVSVGMGIDMEALTPGQYYVVSKSKKGVISSSFLVD